MTRHLLTVEETFDVRGRGLIVAPFLDEAEARRERFEIELRKPCGARVRAMAFAQVPFISPPPPKFQAHLAILGVSKADVPVGTEVWTLIDDDERPT